MNSLDHRNLMSTKQKVARLACVLGLVIGALSIVGLLSTDTVASASKSRDRLGSAMYQTTDPLFFRGAISDASNPKTAEPAHSDTDIVSGCYSIGGLDPRSLDIVLALDVSASMQGQRLADAKNAASTFVGLLGETDRVAVVPFSDTARLAQPLTTTTDIVTDTIYGLAADGGTNIGDGIHLGHLELISSVRYMSDTIKAILLMSDGGVSPTDMPFVLEQAREAASDTIKIYTVGFSPEANQAQLQEIASAGGGAFFFASDGNALTEIYTSLAARRACIYLPVLFRNWTSPGFVNGGFENGWSGWTHGGELAQSITSTSQSGNFAALLGDPAYPCGGGVPVGSAWVEQTIVIPDSISPTLSFWYRIVSQDINPGPTEEFDSFDIVVSDTITSTFRYAMTGGLYGCAPQNQFDNDLGWQYATIDLSSFSGQQVTIRFANWNRPDMWYNSWTFLDDVVVMP